MLFFSQNVNMGRMEIAEENLFPEKKDGLNPSESISEETTHQLAALGRMAGTVAHELNNPLDGILRYLNLSIRVIEQGESDKALEYLRQALDMQFDAEIAAHLGEVLWVMSEKEKARALGRP